MHWIAPSEKDTDNAALGKRLWPTGSECDAQFVRPSTFVLRPMRRLPAGARFDYLLNVAARELESPIANNVTEILEA